MNMFVVSISGVTVGKCQVFFLGERVDFVAQVYLVKTAKESIMITL